MNARYAEKLRKFQALMPTNARSGIQTKVNLSKSPYFKFYKLRHNLSGIYAFVAVATPMMKQMPWECSTTNHRLSATWANKYSN